MRELERCRARRREAGSATPATKSFRSGTCARTLFPTTRLARFPSRTSCRAVSVPEERHERRHAPRLGRPRDVGGWIDAEDRDPRTDEVLQQVAVVRGELDDEIVGSELEPLADHLDVTACVLDPRRRVRGEVRVLGEDLVRRDERLELNEAAPLARRTRAAGRTAPSARIWLGAAGSSRTAATCRGRRRSARAARRRTGSSAAPFRVRPRRNRSPASAPYSPWRASECLRLLRGRRRWRHGPREELVPQTFQGALAARPHRLEVRAIAKGVHRMAIPMRR